MGKTTTLHVHHAFLYISLRLLHDYNVKLASFKVMLHETICNDDFLRNTALQCWNNVVTIRNNVATMLQRCVALKIVVANRPV